jgi:hypothetical protein
VFCVCVLCVTSRRRVGPGSVDVAGGPYTADGMTGVAMLHQEQEVEPAGDVSVLAPLVEASLG